MSILQSLDILDSSHSVKQSTHKKYSEKTRLQNNVVWDIYASYWGSYSVLWFDILYVYSFFHSKGSQRFSQSTHIQNLTKCNQVWNREGAINYCIAHYTTVGEKGNLGGGGTKVTPTLTKESWDLYCKRRGDRSRVFKKVSPVRDIINYIVLYSIYLPPKNEEGVTWSHWDLTCDSRKSEYSQTGCLELWVNIYGF